MTPALRETLATALTLLGFAVLGAGLLSGTYTLTRPIIERSEQAEKMAKLAQTLPAGSFDNDLIADAVTLPATPRLGLKRPGRAYVARKQGVAIGMVLEVVAPDGYAGEIRLLVGILADGRISGVRVTKHNETPGLGDYIDHSRGDWIHQFAGKSLSNPTPDGWRVKKDGGAFDYLVGATISPRAVIKATRQALEYFAEHRAEMLAPVTPPAAASTGQEQRR
jgi:electron transport complex protein RnfG